MKKALAMTLAMMALGMAATAEGRTLTVQGMGMVRVDADLVTVSMGARETAPDVVTAQSSVNAKMEAMIAALREAGIALKDMSTGCIGIYPNYDYTENQERIVNYTANNTLVFKVSDVNGVGAYIDAAFAAGANTMDFVNFSVTDTAEAGDKALELAVESAKSKAAKLAAAAGVTLGRIVEIRDSSENGYDVSNAFATVEDESKRAATQVLPSGQQVCTTVYITYEIVE